ncbi:hypothetical protein JAO29_05990 [Edaphobacter sp. HDX4]|uniref:hypothetical protein n=1 Tax=Edaphobacter sp. HDX4 TaxID=2794064 RepID=UPI003AC45C01
MAFAVGRAAGLATGSVSADYIQLYHGNASLLAESLEAIQQTASVILDALDPSIAEEPATDELAEVQSTVPNSTTNVGAFAISLESITVLLLKVTVLTCERREMASTTAGRSTRKKTRMPRGNDRVNGRHEEHRKLHDADRDSFDHDRNLMRVDCSAHPLERRKARIDI